MPLQGWVREHRKEMDSVVWANPYQFKLWRQLIMMANHSDGKVIFNGKQFAVPAGSMVTGRDAIAFIYNKGAQPDHVKSARLLWKWIKKFEEWQMLTISSTPRYSVISITNYGKYQQSDQLESSSSPAKVQLESTNKNVKNVKKEHSGVAEKIPYAEIVEYLNEKTGKHFTKSAAATKSKINARWHEGRRLTDFKTVIDVKSAEWNGTDAAKWLRPETLFGTKFEAYLNEQPTVKPTSIPTREDLTERTERIRSFVLNRHIDGMDNTSIKQILAEGGADVSLDTIQKIISKGDVNGS